MPHALRVFGLPDRTRRGVLRVSGRLIKGARSPRCRQSKRNNHRKRLTQTRHRRRRPSDNLIELHDDRLTRVSVRLGSGSFCLRHAIFHLVSVRHVASLVSSAFGMPLLPPRRPPLLNKPSLPCPYDVVPFTRRPRFKDGNLQPTVELNHIGSASRTVNLRSSPLVITSQAQSSRQASRTRNPRRTGGRSFPPRHLFSNKTWRGRSSERRQTTSYIVGPPSRPIIAISK